jgi:proline iminopeptidase
MRASLSVVVGFVCSISQILVAAAGEPPASAVYPAIEPFRTGTLKVSGGHEIFYELAGNPKGTPVMMLHGGPGGGSSPGMRRFHDPQKWLIVLHDQRGAGRSKPHLELRGNTTQDLVDDVERLREHLKLGKVHLFGGSWGSTLALAYAEKHPQNVASMVLRGVFTARKKEIDHFYHGGTGAYFPEGWARLRAVLPHPERFDYPQQMLDLLTGKDEAKRKEAAIAWATYETKAAYLKISDAEVAEKVNGGGFDVASFSLIESHYMAHRCFLDEGQLLRDAGRLKNIPTIIVQGRYDVMCPPDTAYELHRALPGSRFVLVEEAGHTGNSPPMQAALIAATKSLETR